MHKAQGLTQSAPYNPKEKCFEPPLRLAETASWMKMRGIKRLDNSLNFEWVTVTECKVCTPMSSFSSTSRGVVSQTRHLLLLLCAFKRTPLSCLEFLLIIGLPGLYYLLYALCLLRLRLQRLRGNHSLVLLADTHNSLFPDTVCLLWLLDVATIFSVVIICLYVNIHMHMWPHLMCCLLSQAHFATWQKLV